MLALARPFAAAAAVPLVAPLPWPPAFAPTEEPASVVPLYQASAPSLPAVGTEVGATIAAPPRFRKNVALPLGVSVRLFLIAYEAPPPPVTLSGLLCLTAAPLPPDAMTSILLLLLFQSDGTVSVWFDDEVDVRKRTVAKS
jgi:hypothetical protein